MQKADVIKLAVQAGCLDAKKYNSKVVGIEAMQYDGSPNCGRAIIEWTGGAAYLHDEISVATGARDFTLLKIDTPEGVMTARPGDFIIKGTHGEFYPCKPDVFATKYEEEVPHAET